MKTNAGLRLYTRTRVCKIALHLDARVMWAARGAEMENATRELL